MGLNKVGTQNFKFDIEFNWIISNTILLISCMLVNYKQSFGQNFFHWFSQDLKIAEINLWMKLIKVHFSHHFHVQAGTQAICRLKIKFESKDCILSCLTIIHLFGGEATNGETMKDAHNNWNNFETLRETRNDWRMFRSDPFKFSNNSDKLNIPLQ